MAGREREGESQKRGKAGLTGGLGRGKLATYSRSWGAESWALQGSGEAERTWAPGAHGGWEYYLIDDATAF